MGSDLGGAVKGFKDGMKDGTTSDDQAVVPPHHVTGNVPVPPVNKTTIDVEAKPRA
jgi:sec-independent protein translocase protein TatA